MNKSDKSIAGKIGQEPDFQWAVRSIFHNLFWMLFIILCVMLCMMLFIGWFVGYEEVFRQSLNLYNLGLVSVCLLFYMLDAFVVPTRTISFQNNTLHYSTKRKGIIHQIPIKDIKAIYLLRIGIKGTNYALFVHTESGKIKIKLIWSWVWNVWKLEKDINKLREFYQIPKYH